jgi:hypothetical protein
MSASGFHVFPQEESVLCDFIALEHQTRSPAYQIKSVRWLHEWNAYTLKLHEAIT